jgi:hypothetical protein
MPDIEIINKSKYQLKEPKWTTTIGQGNPPEGYTHNGVQIPWGSVVTVREDLDDPIETRYNKFVVLPELISQMPEQWELVSVPETTEETTTKTT